MSWPLNLSEQFLMFSVFHFLFFSFTDSLLIVNCCLSVVTNFLLKQTWHCWYFKANFSQDLVQFVGRREVLLLGVEQVETVLQSFELVGHSVRDSLQGFGGARWWIEYIRIQHNDSFHAIISVCRVWSPHWSWWPHRASPRRTRVSSAGRLLVRGEHSDPSRSVEILCSPVP